MNEEDRLQSCLRVWKENYTDKTTSGGSDISHLSDHEIYPLAEDGGMQRADPGVIEHLSICPVCMEKWVGWREAISVFPRDELEPGGVMSYGTLERKAAATGKSFEPTTSLSSCGRFTLGLLPHIDDSDNGLVTLDVVGKDKAILENRYVIIRDRKGRVFLEGKIHDGRLARRFDNLGDIDLSKWTVIEKVD